MHEQGSRCLFAFIALSSPTQDFFRCSTRKGNFWPCLPGVQVHYSPRWWWSTALLEQAVWRDRLQFLVTDDGGTPRAEPCCCMMGQNTGGRASSVDSTPTTGGWGGWLKRSPLMKGKSGGEWSRSELREISESEAARGGQTSLTWGGGGGRGGMLLSVHDVTTSCLSSVSASSGPTFLRCDVSSRLLSLESEEHFWSLRNFALLFLNHTCKRERLKNYMVSLLISGNFQGLCIDI